MSTGRRRGDDEPLQLHTGEGALLVDPSNQQRFGSQVVSSLNEAGLKALRAEKYDKAIEYLTQALELTSVSVGGPITLFPSNLERLKHRAVTLNNLGGVYKARGQIQKALDALVAAMTIERQIIKLESPTTLSNVAVVVNALHRNKDSVEVAQEALKLLKFSQAIDIVTTYTTSRSDFCNSSPDIAICPTSAICKTSIAKPSVSTPSNHSCCVDSGTSHQVLKIALKYASDHLGENHSLTQKIMKSYVTGAVLHCATDQNGHLNNGSGNAAPLSAASAFTSVAPICLPRRPSTAQPPSTARRPLATSQRISQPLSVTPCTARRSKYFNRSLPLTPSNQPLHRPLMSARSSARTPISCSSAISKTQHTTPRPPSTRKEGRGCTPSISSLAAAAVAMMQTRPVGVSVPHPPQASTPSAALHSAFPPAAARPSPPRTSVERRSNAMKETQNCGVKPVITGKGTVSPVPQMCSHPSDSSHKSCVDPSSTRDFVNKEAGLYSNRSCDVSTKSPHIPTPPPLQPRNNFVSTRTAKLEVKSADMYIQRQLHELRPISAVCSVQTASVNSMLENLIRVAITIQEFCLCLFSRQVRHNLFYKRRKEWIAITTICRFWRKYYFNNWNRSESGNATLSIQKKFCFNSTSQRLFVVASTIQRCWRVYYAKKQLLQLQRTRLARHQRLARDSDDRRELLCLLNMEDSSGDYESNSSNNGYFDIWLGETPENLAQNFYPNEDLSECNS